MKKAKFKQSKTRSAALNGLLSKLPAPPLTKKEQQRLDKLKQDQISDFETEPDPNFEFPN